MLPGGSWWGCWDCCTWTWTWTGQSCRQVGMNIFKKRFFLHQILANDWTSGSQLSLSFLLMTLTGEVGGSTSRGRSGFSPRLMSIDWPHIQINHTYHFILSHRVGWSCLVLAEQWGTQLAIGLCLASRSSWPTICWAYRLVFELSLGIPLFNAIETDAEYFLDSITNTNNPARIRKPMARLYDLQLCGRTSSHQVEIIYSFSP